MRRILSLAVAISLSSAPQARPEEAPTSRDRLYRLQNRFIAHAQDFHQLAVQYQAADLEGYLALEMRDIAIHGGSYATTAKLLLDIQGRISSPSDRDAVRSLENGWFKNVPAVVNNEVTRVNDRIGRTQVVALATAGTALKDDLRALQALIASLEAP